MPFQVPLTFIVHTQRSNSCRDEELLKARARSHATRVSRARSKWLCDWVGCSEGSSPQSPMRPSWTLGREETFAALEVPSPGVAIGTSPTVSQASRSSWLDTSTGNSNKLNGNCQRGLDINLNSPWHWSEGFRVDPFNCIPWASEALAELDLCTYGGSSSSYKG